MRFELSTPPASEPVSVRDIEEHTQIGTIPADQIRRVSQQIAAAREMCEARLSRQLITATWKGYLEAFPAEIEVDDHIPVIGISQIDYIDTAGDSQTLSSGVYQSDVKSPNHPARICPAYGQSWPLTRGGVYNAVTVTFTAGYGTSPEQVPMAARQWIMMLVAAWYDVNREATAPIAIHDVPRVTFDGPLDSLYWGAYA